MSPARDLPFFQFEADFVDSLRCIPMQVRHKLDTCGVKLKLSHWMQLSAAERQQLVSAPCAAPVEVDRYRETVQALVTQHTGAPAGMLPIDPHPPWQAADAIPADLQEKARSIGVVLSLSQWQALTPLQRFALIKLSRPGHENRNFLPALQEFGLAAQVSPADSVRP